jgi:alkyldihydroxyacetonephosphate synthase
MRRWNGWGEVTITYHLPDSALEYLTMTIGQGEPSPDAKYEQVLASIPSSNINPNVLINTSPEERLLHARGQSLPDWIALRSGRLGVFPDGVAYPTSNEEVRSILEYGSTTGTNIIPYGGGTSVVGHITPLAEYQPNITVDLSRIGTLDQLDETSNLATFGAGIKGPALEAQLNSLGFTLGHYPQSFEFSTLGGWIATRSSGQQSYYFGRIEELFAGGHVETPLGSLDLPSFPASAAGPDLRQLILGSEGRFGIITQATVRIRRMPKVEKFYGIFFRDWDSGIKAVRKISQENIKASMLRLSDALETETTLILAGKPNLTKWAERGLNILGYGPRRCLLILGITGNPKSVEQVYYKTLSVIKEHNGISTGQIIGSMWRKSRYLTPYLRNTLWEHGYAVDTLETAVPWSKVQITTKELINSLHHGLRNHNELVHAFSHLSHMYVDGASIYTTFIFRLAKDPEETLERWQTLKNTASEVVVAQNGTISHQHGVGLDHSPFLVKEKGVIGMDVLDSIRRGFDPQGIMNNGKLILISR